MSSWFENLFELLFKYRPLIYQRGDFAFGASALFFLLGAVVVAVAVPILLRYRDVGGRSSRTDRIVLSSLRTAALLLVLFCLARPSLVLSTVVPQRSFVGILLDDSKSMQIADVDGNPRGAFLQRAFGQEGSALSRALSDKFMLRFFRFSESAERLADTGSLSFSGAKTHISRALERSMDELSGVPLSGLVVFSDGADNSDSTMSDTLLDLEARKIPVYTVGLGRERFTRDIEVSRVEAPRSVLEGSSLVVDVTISQRGFAGETVRLDVEDDGRIVNTREVELSGEAEATTVRVHFTVSNPGARTFRFKVAVADGEMVTQNNQREQLIHVEDGRQKILYFEGEPRFELKFIRRAVVDDENLQVVCLQRTAENKFYRLEVDDPEELAAGFPKTREELFKYRGIILGSVEASYFTHDQLRMIADFVSQRGGGLLALGGRLAFAEGGFEGTPVAEVLPIVLETSSTGGGDTPESPVFAQLHVEPTAFGATHPVTQFGGDLEASAKKWESLPPLSTLNDVRRVKPGATTLLVGSGDGITEHPVLVFQRYGRGKSIAFTVSDSWQWQMHHEIPLEDMTHELFWRKLLRSLVSYVPDPVSIATEKGRYAPGESVTVRAEVDDERFLKVNNAQVTANVRAPSGERIELPMEWTVDKDGEYRASFLPGEKGIYQLSVDAERDGVTIGSATSYVESEDLDDEYFQAEMRTPLLERIADETGGEFYTPETVSRLPEDMSYSEGGTTIRESRDLWDMPAIFLLLLGIMTTEWGYRKLKGLA
ncbi:MAG TPA: glutamine amidotransferase [Vicinamibacteria bacterium]|nr:glutamine amidotransferase [Vicinamibacteria bacterium]